MKKKLVALLIASTMALTVTACGGTTTETAAPKAEAEAPAKVEEPAESTEKAEEPAEEVTYQSILDEYTAKIEEAAPKLAEEFKTEAASKKGDVAALAELSTAKMEKLAEISVEGVEKMAALMLKNGDSQETYTEWANKLNDVYMKQSEIITNAYMKEATGM